MREVAFLFFGHFATNVTSKFCASSFFYYFCKEFLQKPDNHETEITMDDGIAYGMLQLCTNFVFR